MKHVRASSSVLVAALLHAAAFALVLRLPAPEATLEAGAPLSADAEPVEISILSPPDDAPPADETTDFDATDPPPAATSLAARSEAAADRGQGRADHASASAPATETQVETPAAPETASPPPSGLTGPIIALSPAELGIGGTNPFVASAARQERRAQSGEGGTQTGPALSSEEARKRNPIANALRDAFRGPDGHASEGPVLKALRDATSESLAPLDGRARFAVRINGEGEVYAVDLLEASGGSGWDDAAKRALAGLRGRKIPLPRGCRGANVNVEVASNMSFPSGQKSPAEFGLRPFGERTEGIVIPDESNIGQRPTRKIHSRSVGVELL